MRHRRPLQRDDARNQNQCTVTRLPLPSLQALRRGEIDIQFLFRGELGVEEGIEFALLNMNRLCVNMRKSDPLAAQEIITLDDFRNRTVFIPVQISYSREIVELRRMIAKRNIPSSSSQRRFLAGFHLRAKRGSTYPIRHGRYDRANSGHRCYSTFPSNDCGIWRRVETRQSVSSPAGFS